MHSTSNSVRGDWVQMLIPNGGVDLIEYIFEPIYLRRSQRKCRGFPPSVAWKSFVFMVASQTDYAAPV